MRGTGLALEEIASRRATPQTHRDFVEMKADKVASGSHRFNRFTTNFSDTRISFSAGFTGGIVCNEVELFGWRIDSQSRLTFRFHSHKI